MSEAEDKAVDSHSAAPSPLVWKMLCDTGRTYGVEWHDAYAEWRAFADARRSLSADCQWSGWGSTPDEAVQSLLRQVAAFPAHPPYAPARSLSSAKCE